MLGLRRYTQATNMFGWDRWEAPVDNPILWRPSAERVRNANASAFISFVNDRFDQDIQSFADLHAWSVRDPTISGQAWRNFAACAPRRGASGFWLTVMPCRVRASFPMRG